MFKLIDNASNMIIALYIIFLLIDMFKLANDKTKCIQNRLKAINNLLLCMIVSILISRK